MYLWANFQSVQDLQMILKQLEVNTEIHQLPSSETGLHVEMMKNEVLKNALHNFPFSSSYLHLQPNIS